MKRLTKAEEEVMHIIWKLKRGTVSEMLDQFGSPRPPHSTISSICRILEKKGFLDHKAYGRTYEYFPLVSKREYSKRSLQSLVADYFGGSMHRLVSYIVKEEDLDLETVQKLLDQLEDTEPTTEN